MCTKFNTFIQILLQNSFYLFIFEYILNWVDLLSEIILQYMKFQKDPRDTENRDI
jgi:hypothetical protein